MPEAWNQFKARESLSQASCSQHWRMIHRCRDVQIGMTKERADFCGVLNVGPARSRRGRRAHRRKECSRRLQPRADQLIAILDHKIRAIAISCVSTQNAPRNAPSI